MPAGSGAPYFMSRDRLGGVKTLKVTGFLDEFEKDDIKKSVDIISLFSSFGIELTKKGKSHTGLCPFHDDANPSLSVDRDKGLYNCFGCGESGDVFDLVCRVKGFSFTESLSFLKEYSCNGSIKTHRAIEANTSRKAETEPLPAGSALAPAVDPKKKAPPVPARSGEEQPAVQPKDEETPAEIDAKTNLSRIILDIVSEHYKKSLLKNPESLGYLKGRGFTDYSMQERLGLGFADGSLLSMVGEKQKEELKAFGIITARGRELFSGCITVPFFDEAGRVVSFYGRAINSGRKVKHLYSPGEHKGLVNRKAAGVYREEIILTESVLDALSLIQMGIENVIPCYGTGGFTDEHLSLLKNERVKTVVIAFDADTAGRKGSGKLKEKLTGEGFSVKVIEPLGSKEGDSLKDWNESLQKGMSKEEIITLIHQSETHLLDAEIQEDLCAKKEGQKYLFTIAGVSYRVLGVKEMFVSSLRVNIRAEKLDEADSSKYLDNVDLYSARSRSIFSTQLSHVLNLETVRIEKDLIRIVEYLEEERDKKLLTNDEAIPELTEEEKQLGLSFLMSKNIMREVTEDMTALGYVNEEINKQLTYLAGVSRLLPGPLNIYIQAGSSGGKSALLNTLEKLLPPEAVWKALTISTQAFHYVEEERFLNRVFIMGEDIHDEQIENLVRQMQSEGEVSRLVTLKDEKTGELKARMISKKVNMSFMVTSTSLTLHPENASRCLVISVDESASQTEQVQESMAMRRSWEGETGDGGDTDRIIKKHRSAQRMLLKYRVYNPLAKYIKFPRARPSMRRAYDQFLTLMDSSCLLRQKQKEIITRTNPVTGKTISAIECDMQDYEAAYRLFVEGVLATGSNDIPTGTCRLYEEIRGMLKKKARKENVGMCEISFIRKQVREHTGLGPEFIKKHLRFLVEYEHLSITGGRRHGTRYSYRLREDKPIRELDISIILTPKELKKLIENEF